MKPRWAKDRTPRPMSFYYDTQTMMMAHDTIKVVQQIQQVGRVQFQTKNRDKRTPKIRAYPSSLLPEIEDEDE